MRTAVGGLLRRAVDIREDEVAAVGWSFTYFFLVLASYFVIRPIRDQMGVAGGVNNLAWLFSGTLVGMLLLHPIFTWLVSRYPRRTFIAWIYRVFILMLVSFYLLFTAADATQSIWVGRIFFIWASVFNLFVVSVFWSFMTDTYHPSQGKAPLRVHRGWWNDRRRHRLVDHRRACGDSWTDQSSPRLGPPARARRPVSEGVRAARSEASASGCRGAGVRGDSRRFSGRRD